MSLLYTILGVVHLILFLIAAFEILGSGKQVAHKAIWLLIIFFFPLFGLILYFLLGRGK